MIISDFRFVLRHKQDDVTLLRIQDKSEDTDVSLTAAAMFTLTLYEQVLHTIKIKYKLGQHRGRARVVGLPDDSRTTTMLAIVFTIETFHLQSAPVTYNVAASREQSSYEILQTITNSNRAEDHVLCTANQKQGICTSMEQAYKSYPLILQVIVTSKSSPHITFICILYFSDP